MRRLVAILCLLAGVIQAADIIPAARRTDWIPGVTVGVRGGGGGGGGGSYTGTSGDLE